jgi:hypothetical protein
MCRKQHVSNLDVTCHTQLSAERSSQSVHRVKTGRPGDAVAVIWHNTSWLPLKLIFHMHAMRQPCLGAAPPALLLPQQQMLLASQERLQLDRLACFITLLAMVIIVTVNI